jgi:hypothetical protein
MSLHHTNRRQMLQRLGAASIVAAPLLSTVAYAGVFMDETQALKILHPKADGFVMLQMALDDTKLNAIIKLSETRIPRGFAPRVWKAKQGDQALGWVIADRVIGKYDLIDYAAGFDPQGAALGLEILAYRESHGAEVRQTAWRKQFVGKKGPLQMRFADDIRNISGATLSCQHLTEGMQRLSALAILLVTDP